MIVENGNKAKQSPVGAELLEEIEQAPTKRINIFTTGLSSP